MKNKVIQYKTIKNKERKGVNNMQALAVKPRMLGVNQVDDVMLMLLQISAAKRPGWAINFR